MDITPPDDGYVAPATEPILVELEKELGGKVINIIVNNKEANEARKPITQPKHKVLKSSNLSVNMGKVSREIKSPSRYDFCSSFPYPIANSHPHGVYSYFHPHSILSEGMNTLLLSK